MKKGLDIIIAVKSVACLSFTAIVMLYVVAGMLLGESSISFSLVWQIVFIAALGSTLHFVAFNERILKTKSNAKRMIVFAIPLYVVIAAVALLFQWFISTLINWLIFTLIYIFLLGCIIAVFAIYFKITGQKLNEMLAAYKARQSE